jgi:ABC-type glycerol-3-phosphate transport system substrate-binding protein
MMRNTLVALAVVLALAGCSDDTAPPPTTTTAVESTGITAPPVDPLERNRTVNEYIDLVAARNLCTTIECNFAQTVYDDYAAIVQAANRIPGEDVDQLTETVADDFEAWNQCLSDARESGGDRLTCGADEDAVAVSIEALYDSLR